MTNPTPVEYCRHENCRKPIVVCTAHGGCLAKGYRHTATDFHTCFENGSGQVAEPADPPQQQKCEDCLWHGCIDTQCGCQCHKLKAGTQMEERKPDVKTAEQKLTHVSSTLQTLVKDIDPAPIDNFKLFREELRKELGLPDNRVWTGVGLLLAVRQLREKPVSESANREPQASPMKELCSMTQAASLDFAIGRVIENLDVLDAFAVQSLRNKFKVSERELQEVRAQLETEYKADEEVQKIAEAQELEIASLRGLVGRMLEFASHGPACPVGLMAAGLPLACDCGYTDVKSEAEAAIKEPHNG